jgi:hypothetical protein
MIKAYGEYTLYRRKKGGCIEHKSTIRSLFLPGKPTSGMRDFYLPLFLLPTGWALCRIKPLSHLPKSNDDDDANGLWAGWLSFKIS